MKGSLKSNWMGRESWHAIKSISAYHCQGQVFHNMITSKVKGLVYYWRNK